MTRIDPGNGLVNIKDLPEDLKEQIRKVLGKVPEKHGKKAPVHGDRADILLGSAAVMGALHKSKAPPELWHRILGQCQRWARNPARAEGKVKANEHSKR